MPWEQFVGMVSAEVARTHAHFPALFRLNAAGHVVIGWGCGQKWRHCARVPPHSWFLKRGAGVNLCEEKLQSTFSEKNQVYLGKNSPHHAVKRPHHQLLLL